MSNDLAAFLRDHARLSRKALVMAYAQHLLDRGERATTKAMRELLEATGRGYSLKADQISFALGPLYRSGRIPKQPNGNPVVVEGERFVSANAAAERHGVARQTVLNRIKSDRPRWAGWRMAD